MISAQSQETDADTGLDEDPLNNILPQTDSPDHDGYDDGVKFPIYMPMCSFTTFDFEVTAATPSTAEGCSWSARHTTSVGPRPRFRSSHEHWAWTC
jgi:hypothetical protein